MHFLKWLIDIMVVLLLFRLLIRPSEAVFDPLYRLIYRLTDPLLTPSRFLTREVTKGAILSILGLVVLRALVYLAIIPAPFISALGRSLLDLFHFLFQGYMVIWVVSLLSKYGHATSFIYLVQRAFVPLNWVAGWFGIPRRHFHSFMFLFVWILYAVLSAAIHGFLFQRTSGLHLSFFQGLGEGLILFLALFPFPGFFALVIIIGALLSWVSHDPYNPEV